MLEGTAELSLAGLLYSWTPTHQSRGAGVVCWGSASILQVEGAERIGVWDVCGVTSTTMGVVVLIMSRMTI